MEVMPSRSRRGLQCFGMDPEANGNGSVVDVADLVLRRHMRYVSSLQIFPAVFFLLAVVVGVAGSLLIAVRGQIQELPIVLGAVSVSIFAGGVAYVAGKYLEERSWRVSRRALSLAVVEAAEEVEGEADEFLLDEDALAILEEFPQWSWFRVVEVAFTYSEGPDPDSPERSEKRVLLIRADRVPDDTFEELISALLGSRHMGLAASLQDTLELRRRAASALALVDQIELDDQFKDFRRRSEDALL